MYKSPIEILQQQAIDKLDSGIYQAVLKAGFDVDKEELAKALEYDRGQYEKGYEDGKADTEPFKYSSLFPMGPLTFAIACGCCKNLHSDKCMKCKSEVESGWELDTVCFKPVVHAHWKEVQDPYDECYYECSHCGEVWTFLEGTPKENNCRFCPHCGAKMDEEA